MRDVNKYEKSARAVSFGFAEKVTLAARLLGIPGGVSSRTTMPTKCAWLASEHETAPTWQPRDLKFLLTDADLEGDAAGDSNQPLDWPQLSHLLCIM